MLMGSLQIATKGHGNKNKSKVALKRKIRGKSVQIMVFKAAVLELFPE